MLLLLYFCYPIDCLYVIGSHPWHPHLLDVGLIMASVAMSCVLLHADTTSAVAN